jgi:Spy/CpxP family protein refolding chaperone
MNLRKLLVVIAISVLACASMAQGGGGGRGQRGGYGPLGLLRMAEVQTELALTEDQKTKLIDLQTSIGDQMRQAFQDAGQDPAARQKAMAEINAKSLDEANKILTPDQQKRFRELRIQRAGNAAVVEKDVQDALGLTDDQKAKIKALQDTQAEANNSIQEKMRNQEISREDAMAARQKNTKAFNDGIDAILTDDQKTKLKAMGGKPFAFPAPQGRGGGGLN